MNTLTIKVLAKQLNAPIVSAGKDIIQQLPENSVIIQGSANDPDGTIQSTQWTQIAGPLVTLQTPNSLALQIQSLQDGQYEFQLSVTDNDGQMSSDSMKLSVLQANNIPIADAGVDGSIEVSPVGVSNTTTSQLPLNAYQLIGNGSDTDGTIEGFEWAIINQPNGASAFFQNDNNAIANPVVEGLSIVGDYTLQLTVIDDDGAFGMDTMMITVNPQANQAPKINSIGPMIDDSNKFMGNMPGAINTFGHSEFWKFDVSATDLEGNDINVAVTLMDSNQNPVFTDNTKIIVGGNGIATYTLPTLNVGNQLSPQSYELQIIVDDGSGNSTDQTFKIDLFNSSNNNIANGGLLLQKGVSPKTKNGCFTNYQSTFTVPKGQTGSLVINEIDGTISSQSGTPLNNIGPGVYTWSVSLNNSAQVGVETTVEVVSSLSGGENGILTLKRQASDNANYDGSICQLSQS